MIAYRIWLNDDHLCTAGIDDLGVLSAIVTWVKRAEGQDREIIEFDLDVGGFLSKRREHLRWAKKTLSPGDEIRLEVVESAEVDPPTHREAEDPRVVEESQRRYYEHLKQLYGDQA